MSGHIREMISTTGQLVIGIGISYLAIKYLFLPLLDPTSKMVDNENASLVISKLLGVKRNRKKKLTEKEEYEARALEEREVIVLYQSLNKYERMLAVCCV